MLKKVLLFVLVIFLLVLLNFAAVFWYFYQYVYTFPLDGDISRLGKEYQDATILSDRHGPDSDRYLLVETASGKIHLLVLQHSTFYRNRYRYLPGSTVVVPQERPYKSTVRTESTVNYVTITPGNTILIGDPTPRDYSFIDTLQQLLPYGLLALELFIWRLISSYRKKQREYVFPCF